ncbi:MAG: amino acid ABC transporter permease [Bacillota bacterium]|jgi:His/Glu/Gln/Arg/opine family amino acid ABC transporter permease subunit|nr:amino acid ABC transporter permease [Eubacteriales bacterium]MDI9492163.1 amino acid ABC transporter permease [Bacillota bacterium]NLV70508.1 amino acid ABC transporter permease [Clostridiales bacterium]HPF19164.1 amino acid ABC transporter permease [Bacillota bacterium]
MLAEITALWTKYDYVFLKGLEGTLWLALITLFFGTVVGVVVALMRMSKNKILLFIVNLYIEVLRGTPILLQLYFFWLVLPKISPIALSDTACIVVALIVNSSSYISEIIRAGIQAVDKGQTEAAKSLGMSPFITLRYIVLPQAIKNILPALGNQFILTVKETSLASVFFVGELMTAYKSVQSATFLSVSSLTIAGIIYLIVTYTLSKVVGLFEKRLAVSS